MIPESLVASSKPLVLVVEDEAALATMLRYNLEKQGFRVEEAGGRAGGADPHRRERSPTSCCWTGCCR